jgi:hypothetical protein
MAPAPWIAAGTVALEGRLGSPLGYFARFRK